MEKPVGGEENLSAEPRFHLPHHYPLNDSASANSRYRWLYTFLTIALGLALWVYYWKRG